MSGLEAVTAFFRHEEAHGTRVRLNLVAKPVHVRFQSVCVDPSVIAPDFSKKFFASNHSSFGLKQIRENVCLLDRKAYAPMVVVDENF